MEESFRSSFSQPPKKVQAVRTIAALLLIFGLLPSVINGILSVSVDIRSILLGTLDPIAKIVTFIGWILLLFVVSEKFARYCIIVLASISLIQVALSYQILLISYTSLLIIICLRIYTYSVLLQSKRLSKQSLMWLTFLCIGPIVDLCINISSSFIDNNWGDTSFAGISLPCFIRILSMIAYWKICHSELFEGNASGEIDIKKFLPLNRYMLVTLIMIAVSIAITVVYDRFIVVLFNN